MTKAITTEHKAHQNLQTTKKGLRKKAERKYGQLCHWDGDVLVFTKTGLTVDWMQEAAPTQTAEPKPNIRIVKAGVPFSQRSSLDRGNLGIRW